MRGGWEQLEWQKAAVLARLSGWPDARLRFRPEPAAWCALEVVSHLVNVELGVGNAIRKNLPEGFPVTIKDKARAVVVNCVMRSPIRVKVPPGAKAALPKEAESLAEIASQWAVTREKLGALVGGLPPQTEKRGYYRHPVAGWMTVPTTMSFLSAHLRHHGFQIDRLERAG